VHWRTNSHACASAAPRTPGSIRARDPNSAPQILDGDCTVSSKRSSGRHTPSTHIPGLFCDGMSHQLSIVNRGGLADSRGTQVILLARPGPRGSCAYHRARNVHGVVRAPLESAKLRDKTLVDLVFTTNGCRKTVTKYVGAIALCPQCHGRSCIPPEIATMPRYASGRSSQAWAIYQRLVLRLPYHVITQALEEQFHVRVNQGTIVAFMRNFARDYAEAEEPCRTHLLSSPFVHADETKINIQSTDWYAWVFTDGRHVLFRPSATRECSVVREVLGEYSGILITDFYGGYDSVPCRQQKCFVHLIRDLNNDLWRRPFDGELETFVLDVRNLLVPMMEAVNKYGLRKRNLGKFRTAVDRFYRRVITARIYRSDPVRAYQKRFQRYRHSLFTFLEYDGIPWNNNMGERALRHLTVQRKISGSFYESLAPAYLLLLGMAQTCRFQDKSVLQFLLSGEKDVDAFKPMRRRRSATACSRRAKKNDSGVAGAIVGATATAQAGSAVVQARGVSVDDVTSRGSTRKSCSSSPGGCVRTTRAGPSRCERSRE